MIKNKIKKVMAIIAVTSMLSTMTAITAFAYPDAVFDDYSYIAGMTQNITDTDWVTTCGYFRNKVNASSIYVKNNSSLYEAKISVFGRGDNGIDQPVGDSPNGSTHYNTINLYMPVSEQRLIRQFIHERGYPLAVMYFEKKYNNDGYAAGKWSPDSVGTYDGLNY